MVILTHVLVYTLCCQARCTQLRLAALNSILAKQFIIEIFIFISDMINYWRQNHVYPIQLIISQISFGPKFHEFVVSVHHMEWWCRKLLAAKGSMYLPTLLGIVHWTQRTLWSKCQQLWLKSPTGRQPHRRLQRILWLSKVYHPESEPVAGESHLSSHTLPL